MITKCGLHLEGKIELSNQVVNQEKIREEIENRYLESSWRSFQLISQLQLYEKNTKMRTFLFLRLGDMNRNISSVDGPTRQTRRSKAYDKLIR